MRTERLDELCELIADCPHSTPTWTDTGFLVIRNQNIKNGRLDLSNRSYTDAEHFAHRIRRAKPREGDIVFTREAPMGEVCMIPRGLECCVGQRQVLLRPNRLKIIPRFLLYAFQSPTVQNEILWSEGTGSTVSNVRIPVLKNIKIPCLPLQQQDEITTLLGSLDDRLALLGETNTTIESIAQALFKSWFVDFDPVRAKQEGREPERMDADTASLFPDSFLESELGLVPKGWGGGVLGDIADTVRKQIAPTELHAGLHYLGLEHIPRQSLSLIDWGNAQGLESAKAAFSAGDILFGKLRPYFHKVIIAPFNGVCSTDILVCRPKQPAYYGLVAMHLFSAKLVEYTARLSNGAKMPRINWKDIAAYTICIPPRTIANEYSKMINPLFARMIANVHTAQTLAELRDTLLPRLISGQLRVPDAAALIEEAAA